MLVRSSLAILILALATCGGDDGGATVDATTGRDAPASSVMEVTCPTNPAASFITQATSFSPTTATINVGQIVKFESTSSHPIGPFNGDPSMTDPGIVVPETKTKCFTFTRAGTFKFICTTHFYAGTLTVN